MNTYKISLKGTKKNNTRDITAYIYCNNKLQAFNLAYTFFEKGETNVIYGTEKTGLCTIHRWLTDTEGMRKYAGKYKVYMSSVTRVD